MNFSAFWYLNFAREYRWIVSQDAEIKSDGLGSFAVRDPEFKMKSVEDQLLYKVEYRGAPRVSLAKRTAAAKYSPHEPNF